MNKLKFGSYIKESRLKKDYTQQELADLLFVDVTTVSKWERGVSYPDITLVPDICRVLEISERELIESSHDEEYRKMKKDAKKYNNMKAGTFWTLNICYLVAILTCFIVNIAVNHTLSWFFIVLSSIICSYTFFPTITWLFNKYKKWIFIGSTFVSMSILFLTCSIYASNYWFMIATIGVFLGYFIVFYPLLFKEQKRYLTKEKYEKISKWFLLSYVVGMLVTIWFLLISIYNYVPYNLGLGLLISGGCFMIPIAFGILNLFDVAKTLNKPILLSLAGVLIILVLLALGRSLYLKTTEVRKVYNIEDVYKDIKIEGNTFDIKVYLSDDQQDKIVYVENKKISIESKVVDGVLTINQKDNRKFYDKLFDWNDIEVNLYLSKDLIDSLDIINSTGDIEIDKGFAFNDVKIRNSTGDVEFKSNVSNNLTINNSTGDVEITGSIIGNGLNIINKTGDVELRDVYTNKLDINIGTGDSELVNTKVIGDFNMTGSTGDVKFDGFDANNIYVTVSTGSVKGTILTNKFFIAKSETGSVSVPETLAGGVCKIVTSTGNIKISYK